MRAPRPALRCARTGWRAIVLYRDLNARPRGDGRSDPGRRQAQSSARLPAAIVATSGALAPQRDRPVEDREQFGEALAGHERAFAAAAGRASLQTFASNRSLRSAAPARAAFAYLGHVMPPRWSSAAG